MRMTDTGAGHDPGTSPGHTAGSETPPPVRSGADGPPHSPLELETGGRRLLLSPGGGPVIFWGCHPAGSRPDDSPLAHRISLLGPIEEWDLAKGWAEAVHHEDRDRCLASYRDAHAEQRAFELQYRLRRADGGYGWVHDHGFPCFDPTGAFAGFFGTCTDITGLRRDQERERLLADIATALDTSPSLTTRLRLAGHVLVPEFADLCAIEPAAPGPAGTERAARPLVLADATRPPGEIAFDEAAVQSWLADAWNRADSAGGPPHPSPGPGRIRPRGGRSEVASAPLLAGGRLIGALRLRRAGTRPPFGAEDDRVVEELARRLGLHLDYARLLGIERAARAKVERAAGRAARLQRLAAELSSALTADQVAAVIAAHARSATEIDARVTVVGIGGVPGAGLRVMACTCAPHEPPPPASGDGGGLPAGPPGGPAAVDPPPPALAELLARPRPFWTGAAAEGAGACPSCPPPVETGRAVLLPISLLGEPVGALSIVLPSGREPGEAERGDLIAIAELGAQALGRARRFDLESRVASTLQQSVLPDRLPPVPGATARARYRPASEDRLGGDWYDQVPVHDGRVAVAVGDVSGHGIGAAAVMSQIRGVLSAYLAEGHPPGRALQLTSSLAESLPAEVMVTACCAVVDPAAGTLEYANAGHPPPLVRTPDGAVSFLNAALGPPLGIGEAEDAAMTRLPFPPGSTLLLYTDGLIERRDENLGSGLARLSDRLAGCAGPLDQTADALLALTATASQDDVTILLLSTDPAPPGLELALDGDRAGLAELRERLSEWLGTSGFEPEDAFEIVLACSEAAANSIEHGYGFEPGPIEVRAERAGDAVRLVLRDRGTWREPRVSDRGRGLHVMRELMDSVEVAAGPDGTGVTMVRNRRAPQGE
ncbi:SpoIIE family protein phosphatase [Actinomadura sp. 9N407]|uniref:SpoIIE family protein phosphatase n=1 Tax=Actinomadura sp. 9N407 TaxID=3375154 RepID=UPI0037BCB46A